MNFILVRLLQYRTLDKSSADQDRETTCILLGLDAGRHRSHKPPGGRASCPYAAAHVQLVLGAHEMRGHQRALFTGEPGRQHYRAARSMSCRKAY